MRVDDVGCRSRWLRCDLHRGDLDPHPRRYGRQKQRDVSGAVEQGVGDQLGREKDCGPDEVVAESGAGSGDVFTAAHYLIRFLSEHERAIFEQSAVPDRLAVLPVPPSTAFSPAGGER